GDGGPRAARLAGAAASRPEGTRCRRPGRGIKFRDVMVRNRMTRWLAALMLIASPALGGQVLPLIHPCAVETAQTAGHHGGQHGADHQESAPADQCTCLGSCSVS